VPHAIPIHALKPQVQDGLPGQLPAYRGTLDAARTIVRNEGWQGLYAGLAPSLVGSTVAWGAYLYLYERIKAWHRDRQGIGAWVAPSSSSSSDSDSGSRKHRQRQLSVQQQQQQQQPGEAARLSAGWNLLSAAQAGAIVCVLTNPVWLVKTRLALQTRSHQAAGGAALQAVAAAAAGSSSGGAYRGMLDAFVRIGREEGLVGYYKGFGPSLLLQTTHGAIQFAAYEELKHQAARAGRVEGAPDRQLTSAEVSLYGAASKFLAAGA
jgi:solute carrier family 25 folate transporter 32